MDRDSEKKCRITEIFDLESRQIKEVKLYCKILDIVKYQYNNQYS